MRPIVVLVATACVAGMVAVHAQDVPRPAESGQTLRAATRLVPVSVVVHDGRNRPIEGLRAEDFQLFEDGKEQPVALFSVLAQNATQASAEAAGVFSNRLQSPSGGGVVAIVYDQLNTLAIDQIIARRHILSYLRQVRPEDRVALYALTPYGMQILHDFSKDARSLLRALEARQAQPSGGLAVTQGPVEDAGLAQALDAFAQGNIHNMQAFYEQVAAYTSLEGLEDVASHLAGVPGRKNLIWVSSGFPFNITNFGPGGTTSTTKMAPETRRAARALNNVDIAVYPVDARGLVGAFAVTTPGAPRAAAASLDASPVSGHPFTTLGTLHRPLDGLRSVADWTGGRAFFNTNDLGDAITRAVDDSRLTYILGYYPTNDTWDTKFRKIQVKVARRGAEVRHRSGYFAMPPAPPDARSRQKAIMDALDSPLEATSLPMSVTVRRAEGGLLTLDIRLDPSRITLARQGDRWAGSVDVAIAQTLPTRQHAREVDVTLPIALTDAERDLLLNRGLRLTRTIDLRPDAHQVRIVARDVNSGTTGSVIVTASQIEKR